MLYIRKRAFTLIELLVVVAIIAVLAGILLPSLNRARESAKATRCGSNMHQWGIAAHLYATINDGFLPAKGSDGSQPKPLSNWDDKSLWFNALPGQFNNKSIGYGTLAETSSPSFPTGPVLPFGGMNSIFVCPSATTAQGVLAPTDGSPQDKTFGPYFIQYGIYYNPVNGAYVGSKQLYTFICYNWSSKLISSASNMTEDQRNAATLKIAALQTAGGPRVIIMSEKRMRQDELQPNDPLNPVAQGSPSSQYNNYNKTLVQFKGDWNRFTTRHNDGGNVLFIDGSVELIKYKDMNTPGVDPNKSGDSGDWNRRPKWVWNPNAPAN